LVVDQGEICMMTAIATEQPASRRRSMPWKALVASIAVLLVVAWGASPLFALAELRSAARSHDRDRLEDLVDFPAVRADLKSQLSGAFLSQLQNDPSMKDNPFAAFGAALMPMILDKVIDAYVTPDGIATMIRTAKAPARTQNADAGPATSGGQSSAKSTEAHYEYLGPNKFRVRLAPADAPDRALSLILERRGILRWQLVRIGLPLQSLTAPGDAAAQPANPTPIPPKPQPANVAVQNSVAPEKPGDCVNTTVASIGSRLEGVPDSGSAIQYTNKLGQVSYDLVPGIQQAQVGDAVTLCLVSLPQDCPPGDDRGKVYNAVDQRTGLSWKEGDSEHECGGA
jgi:hypothetical protein